MNDLPYDSYLFEGFLQGTLNDFCLELPSWNIPIDSAYLSQSAMYSGICEGELYLGIDIKSYRTHWQ